MSTWRVYSGCEQQCTPHSLHTRTCLRTRSRNYHLLVFRFELVLASLTFLNYISNLPKLFFRKGSEECSGLCPQCCLENMNICIQYSFTAKIHKWRIELESLVSLWYRLCRKHWGWRIASAEAWRLEGMRPSTNPHPSDWSAVAQWGFGVLNKHQPGARPNPPSQQITLFFASPRLAATPPQSLWWSCSITKSFCVTVCACVRKYLNGLFSIRYTQDMHTQNAHCDHRK